MVAFQQRFNKSVGIVQQHFDKRCWIFRQQFDNFIISVTRQLKVSIDLNNPGSARTSAVLEGSGSQRNSQGCLVPPLHSQTHLARTHLHLQHIMTKFEITIFTFDLHVENLSEKFCTFKHFNFS